MTQIPPLLRRVLAARGIESEWDLEKYFNPSLDDLADAGDLPGVDEAADEILAVVRSGGRIVVFGDYDCDGICATAILVRTLKALGADVEPFLPERLSEGYGMTAASVARMLASHSGVRLVVTVDNGINSVEEVAWLKAKGIDVIVTDHHLPGDTLPDCTIINPKNPNTKVEVPEELLWLCGAGVAFFLANALVDRARGCGCYSGGSVAGPLLVLAGLATVTDIMPLTGQNRIMVSAALRHFAQMAPIGLKELYSRAQRVATRFHTSKDFGFLLGPRINAAGRLADGMEALELVLSDDREIARELARMVDGRNTERKSIEQAMTDEAVRRIVEGAPAQVIDLPGGHPGVAGIVAARVMERIGGGPVCVVVDGRGSARAPGGYNLRDAFIASAETLDRFGGHAAAGGFSVKPGMIDRFRELFVEACASQCGESCESAPEYDAVAGAADLTMELADAIALMEPFGEGNPEPVFKLPSVRISAVRTMGPDGRHLQFVVNGVRSVWWGRGDLAVSLSADGSARYDIYCTVERSEYGAPHVEVRPIRIEPEKP